MDKPDGHNETSNAADNTEKADPISSGLKTEKRNNASTGKSSEDQHNSAYDADRELRAIGQWIAVRLKTATIVEVSGIIRDIALVTVGVVAACIYYGQLKQMSKQLPEIQKSASAAKTSAEAAKSSADTQREQLVSTQEAVLTMRLMNNSAKEGTTSVPWGIRLIVENTGHVNGSLSAKLQIIHQLEDGRNATICHRLDIQTPKLPPAGDRPPWELDLDPTDCGMSLRAWERMQDDSTQGTLLIKGTYQYENGFKDNITGEFCQEWIGRPAFSDSRQIGGSVRPYMVWVDCRQAPERRRYWDHMREEAQQ